MTLSSTLNRFVYNGNAVTDTFAFPALFYDNAHIVVTVDGFVKTEGVHYTVTGVALPAGGSVIFIVGNIPPIGTANVILERIVPLDQQADPQNFDGNPALSTEIVYDLMSMRIQQVQDQVSRAPQLSIGTTLSSVKLPDPIDQEFPIWSGITGLMINSGVNITSLLAIEANAAASAAAALVSENSAAADVVLTNADVVLTNADVVSTAASAVAAAASAATLQGTSTTSLAIAVASKVFTTQSGKQFNVGEWLLVTSDANTANYMHGQVTSYVGTTLTLNVTNIGGAGTFADWTIRVSGTRGAIGPTGPTGATGPAGPGDLISTNNLSDVVSAPTSLANLGGIGAATTNALTNKTYDANGTGNVLSNIDIGNAIAASQVEAEAGVDNTKLVTSLRVAQAITALGSGGLTLGTPVTASGTGVLFTGIPAGTKQIMINLDGTSMSGADQHLIQIGDSGGIETSGYESVGTTIGTGASFVNSTAGFITRSNTATIALKGTYFLTLVDASTNTWVCSGSSVFGTTLNAMTATAGGKSLTGTLTQLKILPSGGNTFDAGKINISYQ